MDTSQFNTLVHLFAQLSEQVVQLSKQTAVLAQRIEEVHQELVVFRQETAEEFAKVRQEMADEFVKVRQEMASEFLQVRQEMADGLATQQAISQEVLQAFHGPFTELAEEVQLLKKGRGKGMLKSLAS